MGHDLEARCPRCGSPELTTIIVPTGGSLLSVEYCEGCSLPNWRDAKQESLPAILAPERDAEG